MFVICLNFRPRSFTQTERLKINKKVYKVI